MKGKLIQKIVGVALGLTMAIGVGVAVASSSKEASPVHATTGYDTVYTLDCTSSSVQTTNNTYGKTGTVTVSNVGWTFTGNGKINPWRIGGKTAQSGNQPFWTTTAYPTSPSTINRIEVTFGSISGLTFSSFSASIHNSASDAESGSNAVATFSNLTHTANTTVGIDLGASYSGKFYRFVPNVTISATSNKYLQLSKVEFLKTQSIPATSISLASANYTPVNKVITLNVGDGTNNSVEDTLTATVGPNTATDKTVSWSSDNENVAVVIDGKVVVDTSAEGEATITASANGGTNVTDTMTYSVIDPDAATLDHVTVTGSAVSPQYAGNSFNYTGLTFTAVYDDESTESITGGDINWNTLAVGNAATGTYSVGGTTVNVSVPVTVLANTLTVSITGSSLTKTNYLTNESWTYAPLIASGSYADGSSYSGVFTWSFSPATPAAMGVGDGQTLRITATASSSESAYVDVIVNVTAPTYTNKTNLTPGNYFMSFVGSSDNTYYFTGSITSGEGNTSTSSANAAAMTFSLVGNDTWTVTDSSGNYLRITGTDSKNLALDGTSGQFTIDWLDSSDHSKGRILTSVEHSTRSLAQYNNKIRTYANSNAIGFSLTTAKTISGFSVYSTGANKNVLKGTDFTAEVAAAAGFQARLNYTDNSFDDVTAAAEWILDTTTTGTKTLTVNYLTYTDTSIKDMNVYVATIKTLSVNVSGAKTSYVEGEQLNTAGLVITGYEQDSTAHTLPISDCTFSPANGATLATSDTTVTVTYTNEDSTTATTTYTITVATFVGYNKVTSTAGLAVGESYVLGIEHETHGTRLMSDVNKSGTSAYRTWVDATDAFNSEKTTVTQSGAATAGAVVVTLLSDGDGKYAFYDITNNKYLTGHTGTSNDNYLHDSDSLSDAGDNAWWTISFVDSLMSVTLNGSTRVLGYNISSPRFSTYASYASSTSAASGTAHPVLFKMAGSSVKTAVTSFANTSLKMNDPAYEGDITTSNCASNYEAMKEAYVALSDAEKNVFQYSDEYSAARARLVKWAIANGETFTYGNSTPFASARSSVLTIFSNNGNTISIIVIITTISLTAMSGYFYLRKRKEN